MVRARSIQYYRDNPRQEYVFHGQLTWTITRDLFTWLTLDFYVSEFKVFHFVGWDSVVNFIEELEHCKRRTVNGPSVFIFLGVEFSVEEGVISYDGPLADFKFAIKDCLHGLYYLADLKQHVISGEVDLSPSYTIDVRDYSATCPHAFASDLLALCLLKNYVDKFSDFINLPVKQLRGVFETFIHFSEFTRTNRSLCFILSKFSLQLQSIYQHIFPFLDYTFSFNTFVQRLLPDGEFKALAFAKCCSIIAEMTTSRASYKNNLLFVEQIDNVGEQDTNRFAMHHWGLCSKNYDIYSQLCNLPPQHAELGPSIKRRLQQKFGISFFTSIWTYFLNFGEEIDKLFTQNFELPFLIATGKVRHVSDFFGLNFRHFDFPKFFIYSYPKHKDFDTKTEGNGTVVRILVVNESSAMVTILVGGGFFATSRLVLLCDLISNLKFPFHIIDKKVRTDLILKYQKRNYSLEYQAAHKLLCLQFQLDANFFKGLVEVLPEHLLRRHFFSC